MSIIEEMWSTDRNGIGLHARSDGSSSTIRPKAETPRALATRWSAHVIAGRVERHGANPVVVDGKTLTWVTDDDPAARKRRVVHGLCWTPVADRYSTHSEACGRPVTAEGETLCAIHANVLRRREKADAERKARAAERETARNRDRLRTRDLDTMWNQVCGLRSLRPYKATVSGSEATVNYEVLMHLLRELRDR